MSNRNTLRKRHREPGYTGPTYYGRSQLKPAPFNNWVVGGYIFLAGVSGSSALLSAVAELGRGRKAAGMARRGRYLSLLAPTLGAALLVYDLHTPKRFYNMLRIAKKTSPMSIGTWILLAFSAFAGVAAGAQIVADITKRAWPQRLATLSPDSQQLIQAARQWGAARQSIAHQALANSSNRFASLQTLISTIGSAGDQKGILDLQARINAELGMLQNEQTKLQVLNQSMLAQESTLKQQAREMAIEAHGRFATRFQPVP